MRYIEHHLNQDNKKFIIFEGITIHHLFSFWRNTDIGFIEVSMGYIEHHLNQDNKKS